MSSEDLTGGYVIAISPQTLWWATDEMTASLAVEKLQKLNVRAGEHLAALLATAFLSTPPARVDTAGDVDLWFDLSKMHNKT